MAAFNPAYLQQSNVPLAQQIQQLDTLQNTGLMQTPANTAGTTIAGVSNGVAGGGGVQPGMFSQGMSWLGDNSQGLGSLLQGIGALSSIFSTNKQIGLAQDNLNFQKEAYNTNLSNQISTYNTNLEDRIRGRYAAGDQSESQVQDYLNKNRLSK
ncbi:gp081 [Erwinia phage vB_EamP-S6]|uniref:Gp081 n=1 Tax=Erwinia phage vB_EamP-S6 TaxID=1051675 RepID=G0YQH3_9CAUD|nr:gp081 [Erwinia phage vB_EamP-S6]AEJ81600.1 gp081 [Erwinia phage vB_EamP-S6]